MADQNLFDFIRKPAAWITWSIAFVSAVVGFVKLWQGDAGLVTVVLLVVGAVGFWLGCAYLAFKRTPPLVPGGRGIWEYSRWRPWALVGLIALPSVILGVLLGRYLLIPVSTLEVPNVPGAASAKLILSRHAEIFSFDDGNTGGWRPFEWDTGWIFFEESGNLEVVEKSFELDGHGGPFLKYPLDLEAEEQYASLKRNAIYYPANEKVIGIVANIFYESDDAYSHEEIYAGFVVPYRVEGKELSNEDFMKKLIPNRWNTIAWSLYGPVWWGSEDKDEEWDELKELFGDEAANLYVGRRLDHVEIEKIGIQFFVNTEGGPKQFKGTAYIDNIILIYRHIP